MPNERRVSHVYEYKSLLRHDIDSFVQEKRAIGYRYDTEAKNLAHFDRYLSETLLGDLSLSRDCIEKYTHKTPWESPRTHRARVLLIRQFCLWLQQNDGNAYVIPNGSLPKRNHDFVPYIFSNQEISRLIHAADTLAFTRRAPYRHIVAPMFIRLLCCCGLRVSEVLRLSVDDVDLENGILHIYNGKFGKDRIVPMSVSLTQYCVQYISKIHASSSKNAVFLPTSRGGEYDCRTAYSLYRLILFNAGISHGGVGHGPRLHDLRHTFAVHRLKNWAIAGVDINAMLPFLSTYMGHEGLAGTQDYLRLTADVFPQVTGVMETSFGSIIPDIGGDAYDTL
jgi:integrase/recombinase XerD